MLERKSFSRWDAVSQVCVAWESLAMFQLQKTGNATASTDQDEGEVFPGQRLEFCGWGYSNHLSYTCRVPCPRAAALPFCVPFTGTWVTRHLPLSLDCAAAEEEVEIFGVL